MVPPFKLISGVKVLRRWSLPIALSVSVHAALLVGLAQTRASGDAVPQTVVRVSLQPLVGEEPAPAADTPVAPLQQADLSPSSDATAPLAAVSDPVPGAAVVPVEESIAVVAGSPVPDQSDRWEQELHRYLQGHMRYPRSARMRRQQGVAELMFELDGRGQVQLLALAQSSGVTVLDQEALALVRRAAPLPPPPAGTSQRSWQVTVPIRFSLQ